MFLFLVSDPVMAGRGVQIGYNTEEHWETNIVYCQIFLIRFRTTIVSRSFSVLPLDLRIQRLAFCIKCSLQARPPSRTMGPMKDEDRDDREMVPY